MTEQRKVQESPKYQGEDEQLAYIVDFENWGAPSSPTVVIYDSTGADTSSTNLEGSPSVSGYEVTTPTVKALVAGDTYRLEIKVTISGNVMETYCEIIAEK